MKSAILLIIFNRPNPTRRVFEEIRLAKPPRLYIAADGPREGKLGEQLRCEEARSIAKAVDWPCELKLLFRDENLGCRRGVSGAIDWFFENEEAGIILEDDCLPATTFFPFCDALLERYKNDDRIAQISGSNFIGEELADGASYFFSNYPDIWGWATWRRSWQYNDLAMRAWPESGRKLDVARQVGGGCLVNTYWRKNFDDTWRGRIDTWDYQWLYSIWRRNAVNIIPAVNQIENIGYGDDATHTTHTRPSFLRKAGLMYFPLVHPPNIDTSLRANLQISAKRYDISLKNLIAGHLRTVPLLAKAIRRLKLT